MRRAHNRMMRAHNRMRRAHNQMKRAYNQKKRAHNQIKRAHNFMKRTQNQIKRAQNREWREHITEEHITEWKEHITKSVRDFQSMKSPVELNNLLLKFCCYVTWLMRGNSGSLANEAYLSKSIVSLIQ